MNKTQERERKWYGHWQNLSKDDGKGSFPFHGRAWCYFGSHRRDMHVEWHLGGRLDFRAEFSLGGGDGDDDIQFSLAVPGISLYLTFAGFIPSRRREQRFGFYTYHHCLWWHVWSDVNESSSKDPWWRRTHCFDPVKFLLGKDLYSRIDLMTFENVPVPMPEGVFPATVTFYSVRRARARTQWLFNRSKFSASIDVPNPPKFPGKGENSWDQGDDGVWYTSMPERKKPYTVAEVVGHYVSLVYDYRLRRAGKFFNVKESAAE